MSSLGGQSCSPPSLVASVLFALGHYFCSRGAVSSFSSYCYGCCQLLLRLLGVFLLLVLVHLQFPLGVLRLAALLGFPCWLLFSEWQTVREALLFLLCPGSCGRFIGVRGVGSFFRTFGFQEVGVVSFRTLSGGCLSLHWQAWRGRGAETWVVEVLRLGYCLPFLGTPHVPLFPSQCLIPAPSPSRGLLWRKSPWSWLPRMLWSLLHSLLQASTAIC